MSELLLAYTLLAVFQMPLQDNYWVWKIIGFAGLGVFQGRWLVQWLHSEKHKESKVPPIFWWLSIWGALLETAYFLRQQDSVGICGYAISFVPYVRNLMLVYNKRKRDAAVGFEVLPPAASSTSEPTSLE